MSLIPKHLTYDNQPFSTLHPEGKTLIIKFLERN